LLLTLNCIVADEPRIGFNEKVMPRLMTQWKGEDDGHAIVDLLGDGPLPDHAAFTHLLLSGSELSAAERNDRDDELMACIREFADAGKPIYGICYGHQMVARALAGEDTCRRAAVPEFGWRKCHQQENALFDSLPEIIAVHSHYDEVCNLPDTFQVIASTDDCVVQGFQVRGAPIWGTQFHPEMSHNGGSLMLQDNLRTEPLAPAHYVDDLDDPARVEDNLRLFANFFATPPQ
jgi:GMP synthase-like glutamine amidotransferase